MNMIYKGGFMQKYAKKMIAVICLFLISTLWYQSDNAEINSQITDILEQESENDRSQSTNVSQHWFNIACVPSHLARHGLDTDLRKKGLSQFTKNIHAQKPGHRSNNYRCYFRVNPDHIGCFNPQLITREYLEENGYDATKAFPGGAPGNICYFKKEFANHYTNLITILKRNGAVHDLSQHLVSSGAQAVEKLSETSSNDFNYR
jgi:hypothetical protein